MSASMSAFNNAVSIALLIFLQLVSLGCCHNDLAQPESRQAILERGNQNFKEELRRIQERFNQFIAKKFDPLEMRKKFDPLEMRKKFDPLEMRKKFDPLEMRKKFDPLEIRKKFDPLEMRKKFDPLEMRKKFDPLEMRKRFDPLEMRKRFDPLEMRKRLMKSKFEPSEDIYF